MYDPENRDPYGWLMKWSRVCASEFAERKRTRDITEIGVLALFELFMIFLL
jgi:hypothetical protein